MSKAEPAALGHTKQPLLRVIRTNCIGVLRRQPGRSQPLHYAALPVLALSKANPFHRPELSEEQRAARMATLQKSPR